MRIDNNNLAGIQSSAAGASQQIRPADKQNAGTASVKSGDRGNDEVQLSSVAGRVSAGNLDTDSTVSSERSARIDQLTQLVQSGQYNPDPEKVADSIIRDMLPGSGSA